MSFDQFLFDSHVHWLPMDIIENAHFYSKAWNEIEAYLEIMDDLGIQKALLTYPTSDAHFKLGGQKRLSRIYNENLAKIIKKYPNRFEGAAVLPVENSREMLEEWRLAHKEFGFNAISLATSYEGIYLDDERFLPLYKEAQEDKIPIFVHSQIIDPIGSERVKDPLLTPVIGYIFDTTVSIGKLLMSGVLREFEGVTFIFGYYGGVLSFLRNRFDTTYQMLRSINFIEDLKGNPTDYFRQIYVDTGGDTSSTNLLSALELFGYDHILWGSEWPANKNLQASLKAINLLPISEEAKKGILGRNLKSLIEGV